MLFKAKMQLDKILAKFGTSISQFVARLISTKKLWSKIVFLIRCIFWLGVGFMVIKPFAFDQTTAAAMADDAMKRGSEMAIEQAQNLECAESICQTIKVAALVTSVTSNKNKPMTRATANNELAPTPPPRPVWLN